MQRTAVLLSLALAAPAAFSAELGCQGGYNFRLSGTEIDTTNYRFRNFNANRTLTITAINVYAFDGTVLFSLAAGSFPATFNPVLGPHQTTGLNLDDLFGNNEAPNNFVQTVVTWEADRPRADPLYATAARITRARNAVTGVQGETKARAILTCRGERAGS
jgi:hypothetical protein